MDDDTLYHLRLEAGLRRLLAAVKTQRTLKVYAADDGDEHPLIPHPPQKGLTATATEAPAQEDAHDRN